MAQGRDSRSVNKHPWMDTHLEVQGILVPFPDPGQKDRLCKRGRRQPGQTSSQNSHKYPFASAFRGALDEASSV
jgi:hypothetical protein